MDEKEWKKLGYTYFGDEFIYNSKQLDYYNRIEKFSLIQLITLINPGGMALGKTYCIALLIKKYLDKYDLIFIITPNGSIKYVWDEMFKRLGLNDRTITWVAWREACLKKVVDGNRTFPQSQCDDNCHYAKDVVSDEGYSSLAREMLDKFKNMKENNMPVNFYEDVKKQSGICKDCLHPAIKMGLADRYTLGKHKIIIGDFIEFIKPEMFERVTKRKLKNLKTLLIVDEIPLLRYRVANFFSYEIYLPSDISKLQEEYLQYKKILSPTQKHIIQQLLNNLEKFNKKKKLEDINTEVEEYNFKQCVLDIFNNDELFYQRVLDTLLHLSNHIKKTIDTEKQRLSSEKLYHYFDSLLNNSKNADYGFYLKPISYRYNKLNIQLTAECLSPANYLRNNVWWRWDNVIGITGTPAKYKNLSLYELGINEKDCQYDELIKSYDFSNNTFIISEGDFGLKNRVTTYKSIQPKIKELLTQMEGKTMMYVQSKKMSHILEKQLNSDGFNIVNLCEDNTFDYSTPNENFIAKLNEFIKSSDNTVGVMNTLGRVESANFKNIKGIPQLFNSIMLGVPLKPTTHTKKLLEKYLLSRNDNTLQKVLYNIHIQEIIEKIEQSITRTKRTHYQEPVNILIGERFHKEKNIFIYPGITKPKNDNWRIVDKHHNIFHSLRKDFTTRVGNWSEAKKFIDEVNKRRHKNGRNN